METATITTTFTAVDSAHTFKLASDAETTDVRVDRVCQPLQVQVRDATGPVTHWDIVEALIEWAETEGVARPSVEKLDDGVYEFSWDADRFHD